jgi:predicted component of type VI protein secretion system
MMDHVRRKREGVLFQNYTYRPLDENAHQIRLMTLLPGELHDELQIKLRVCAFTPAKRLRFEALSYTWGSTNDPA